MPTPPVPPIDATLDRIERHLCRLVDVADAFLELELERYDPSLGKRLSEGLTSLHGWHRRFSE